MGNGKGNPEYWVAEIQPGKVLYEMDGVDEVMARTAFALAASKLPIRTTFVHRLMFQGSGGRPLHLTQTASHVEACPITLTEDSLTIQFPSGNTLVCYRLHRG